MIWHRTEEEVDEMIKNMSSRIKGNYITQGVSFNKSCPRQMALLKNALLYSASFSGLTKEILALKFNGDDGGNKFKDSFKELENEGNIRDVGNFF